MTQALLAGMNVSSEDRGGMTRNQRFPVASFTATQKHESRHKGGFVFLVEAGGIEPPSEGAPRPALHA